jgi:polyferredoxin
LDAGANDPHPRRVFLNALIYGLIVLALWLGAAPFYWRDFWEWAMEKPARPRALGGALVAYGLLLAFVATTYGS